MVTTRSLRLVESVAAMLMEQPVCSLMSLMRLPAFPIIDPVQMAGMAIFCETDGRVGKPSTWLRCGMPWGPAIP